MIKRESFIACLIKGLEGPKCFRLLQSKTSSLAQPAGVTEVLTGAGFAIALVLSGNGCEGKDDCSADQIAKPKRLSMNSQAKNRCLLALYLGPYWPVMAMRARMMAVLTRLPRPWLLKTSTTVRPRKFLRLLKLLARSLAELDACIIQGFKFGLHSQMLRMNAACSECCIGAQASVSLDLLAESLHTQA